MSRLRIVIIIFSELCYFYHAGFAKDCETDLKNHKLADVYLKHLKWVEPKSSRSVTTPNGETVQFECPSGFLNRPFYENQMTFKCTNGLYNGTFQYSDILCRNEFHKSTHIEPAHAAKLRSNILKCDRPEMKLFEIGRVTPETGNTNLYYVCLDKNTMRTKFAALKAIHKPTTWQKFRPVQRQDSRDSDVWGFDWYGTSAEERMVLSQVYVKKIQQERLTKLFPKLNQGKQYPYYFNRGHLVSFRDFYDYEDQKTTVEYLNAAPQWDILNKHSWSLVEQEARAIVENNPTDWELYTGTYGTIQTPKGPMFAGPNSSQNKARSVKMPVPQLFWKLVHNKKDRLQTRAFIGVNNPDIRRASDVIHPYLLCRNPIKNHGKTIMGDENLGFTYECPLDEFLAKLSAEEKVVK